MLAMASTRSSVWRYHSRAIASSSPERGLAAEDTRKFYRLTTRLFVNKDLRQTTRAGRASFSFVPAARWTLPPDSYVVWTSRPSSYVRNAYNESDAKARRDGKPMVITSYNDMPDRKHESFAYAWEVRDSVGVRWIATEEEIRDAALKSMSSDEFAAAAEATRLIASRLATTRLAKAPMIRLDGDLTALAREGQAHRLAMGHIKEWTAEYEERFKLEIEQITIKNFDSYFLVVSDLIRYAKQHMLVGPGRGSSAGSLVCYLLGITEVDPIPHDLLFYRFIDVSRSDLPDIDIDFADTKRHLVFDYLKSKYGNDNVCKLGNINTLKSLSVLAQVGKKFGISIHETSQIRNSLIEYSSADERYGKGLEDTMRKTAPGQEFREKFPEASVIARGRYRDFTPPTAASICRRHPRLVTTRSSTSCHNRADGISAA